MATETNITPKQFVENVALMQQLRSGQYRPIQMPSLTNPTNEVTTPPTGLEKATATTVEQNAQALAQQQQQAFDNANAEGAQAAATPKYNDTLLEQYNNIYGRIQNEQDAAETAQKAYGVGSAISAVADGISGIANLWGAAKGATPMQVNNTASGVVSDAIAKDAKLRGERINALYKNLENLERLGIQRDRANTYATRVGQRQQELDMKADQFAKKYGLEADKVKASFIRLEQAGRRLDLMSDNQKYKAVKDSLDRASREKIAQNRIDANVAATAHKEEQKAAEKKQKDLDNRIKALGGDITSFKEAQKAAIASGADADKVKALQPNEAGVRSLIALAPKWAEENGYAEKKQRKSVAGLGGSSANGKKAYPGQ